KKPTAPSGLDGSGGGDDEEEDPSKPSTPSPKAPGAAAPRPIRTGPAEAMRARLSGFDGGRLAASDFGATAPCGLGEVHLLAFDPLTPPGIDDPWAQTRMIDLVGRAWDRRARVALPVGGGERGVTRLDDVRRALDPH